MNLPKIYEPDHYEADIYTLWETSGAFQPKGKGKPYSIVMPPPNANASLHTGHAMYVVQDIMIRYRRMMGDRSIYIPGADHAGFETWVVYEKHLQKQGKSRFDYSRDELYKQVWDFVAENRGLMEVQLRQMGLSCDWSKLVFTLDNSVVKIAYDTFKKMWDDKLIYRGERIVNYCTFHGTSFADIEVEYKQAKTKLWHIAFPLTSGDGEVIIATTRPETMLGDVAVAVNPKDERFTKYIGKDIALPLTDRTIPIIADKMVDMDFGTGAVKITPAHDPNDFEVVERHKLPRFSVIDTAGTMNENSPEKYRGLSVIDARKAVVSDLKKLKLLRKEEDYEHSVGHCYKCGTIIQPLLLDQWFIDVKPLAEKAIAAIEGSEIRFVPENKARILVNYLKNLKDWNISRQPAWGIPIPAFQNVDDPQDWIFDDRVGEQTIEVDGKTYQRDPDTFDTWFSSSQWPFIVTKYHDSGELADFFPNSVMQTAADILFSWVARMIMMSLYRENIIPFKEVYLYGLVLDGKGQKMSKSKGNVVNPQEVMKEYGSDALRLGLVASRSAGQNQAFGVDKVIAGRNFCNKLWNIARYVEGALGETFTNVTDPEPATPADHWIIRELSAAKQQVAAQLEEYRYAEAFETVYHTIWDKMADWYIEASKSSHSASTMAWALEACLVMAHPFAPFVTETIWQTLDWHNDEEDMLITTDWHLREDYIDQLANQFETIKQVIIECREVLSEIKSIDVALFTSSALLIENGDIIRRMSRVGYVQSAEKGSLRLLSVDQPAWLDLDEKQITTYRQRMLEKLEKSVAEGKRLVVRLDNKSYIKNAPADLVEETKAQLQTVEANAKHLRDILKQLSQT